MIISDCADTQTGLVSPTLAFNAEILEWPFDFDPPKGRRRHHLKIDTHIDTPNIEIEIVVRDEGPLSIHWSAIGEYATDGSINLLTRLQI